MEYINEEESEKESDEENEKESGEDNEDSNENEEEEEKNDNSSDSGSQKNEVNIYKPLDLQSSMKNVNIFKNFTRKLKNFRDVRRKDVKSSTILLKHTSSINSENINYPLDDLRPIPVITSSQKELIHIFMTEGERDFLLKKLFNKKYFAIREEQIKDHLKMFIPLYYEKLFKGKGCLQNRLAISLSKKMKNVKPNFSIAFEMDEKFKNNEIVKEQSSKYLLVKKDILKHLDINKEGIINYDPFSKIKFKQGDPTKKEPLPKWAVSLKQQFENRDASDDDDDDDDEEEFNIKNYRKLSASTKSVNLKESVKSLNNIKDKIKNEEEDEDNNEEEPFEYPYKKYIKKLFYPKLDDFRKDIIKDCFRNKNVFGKIDFERFICLLEFFISLFSGIQVKYSIDELGFLNMDFYASESIYMNMAEIFHYQVQFQIRDVSCIHGAENKVKPSLIHLNTKQNYEFSLDKIEYFPPSTAFIQDLSNKFRRYTATDNYHLCDKCEKAFSAYQFEKAPCNSSVFRFIDKTRLLIMTLSGIIDMNYLENRIKSSNDNDNDNQNKLVKATMILRNEELINEFKDIFILNSYILPFSTKKNEKLNSTFRNIFGETVGYYYTWISHYLTWIIFPAILGLITEIVLSYIDKNHIHNYIYLIFITFILLWGFYYVKDWDNYQMFYNHIWGMDSFSAEITNLYDDNYSKVSYVTFLGIKIPKIDKVYSLLVNFISVVLVLFSSLFIMGINVGIFQAHNINSIIIKKINKIFRYFGLPQDISKYTLPILIFIVREALSHFFYKFSETLANLERPTDKEEYEEIVTKKRLTLEFVNYYFNLYYIAFYKRAYNTCENDDCFLELRKQLILILISNILSVITQVIYRIIYLRNNIKSFEVKVIPNSSKNSGIIEKLKFYTREQFTEDDIQRLIIPIIFNFGYVIQFGICCPISFVFLLILVLLSRITNSISMIYLLYVKTMNISRGLTVYNRTQFLLVFIGIFSNIGIVFYTKNNSQEEFSLIYKLMMVIIIQNGILIIYSVFQIDNLPFWFRYKDNIKLRYLKKFGVIQNTKYNKINDELENLNLENENNINNINNN